MFNFISANINTEPPNPVVPMARAPTSGTSTASRPLPSTSRSLPSLDTQDSDNLCNILVDMEHVSAEISGQEQPTSKGRHTKRSRRNEEDEEEQTVMIELRNTMVKNQELLQKLLEERQPEGDRETFIQYVADTLRRAPQAQYDVMKDLIADIVRHPGHDSSRDSRPSSSAISRPPQAVSAPPTTSSTIPDYSTGQPYSQQPYYQAQSSYDGCSNWQLGGGTYHQVQQQVQQQSFPTQQPTLNTPRQHTSSSTLLDNPFRHRESADNVGRFLGSLQDTPVLHDLDSGLPSSSQGSLNTPNQSMHTPTLSRISPGHRAQGGQGAMSSQGAASSSDKTDN